MTCSSSNCDIDSGDDAATNIYLHAGKRRINTQDVRLVGELVDKAPLSLPSHYLEFQTGALAYTVASTCLYARPHSDTKDVDIGMLETVRSKP